VRVIPIDKRANQVNAALRQISIIAAARLWSPLLLLLLLLLRAGGRLPVVLCAFAHETPPRKHHALPISSKWGALLLCALYTMPSAERNSAMLRFSRVAMFRRRPLTNVARNVSCTRKIVRHFEGRYCHYCLSNY
jgi:hypothetical protein